MAEALSTEAFEVDKEGSAEQPPNDKAIKRVAAKRYKAGVKAVFLNTVSNGNLIFSFEYSLIEEVKP